MIQDFGGAGDVQPTAHDALPVMVILNQQQECVKFNQYKILDAVVLDALVFLRFGECSGPRSGGRGEKPD